MKINNSKIRKKLTPKRQDVTELVRDFMDRRRGSPLRPTRDSRYVGIEVECFGPLKRVELQALVLTLDLENYVQIGYDSSIRRPRRMYAYELRILLPEGRVGALMKKFGKLFTSAKLDVNSSCGLHVHIDMRSRPYIESFNKLIRFQDLLYCLVAKERWRNTFCKYAYLTDMHTKYRAISGSSRNSKQTVEVRLHEGCVDAQKIEKWVKLLLAIVNGPYQVMPELKKDAVVNWAKKPLKDYIKATFNEEWQKEKPKYAPDQQDRNTISLSA